MCVSLCEQGHTRVSACGGRGQPLCCFSPSTLFEAVSVISCCPLQGTWPVSIWGLPVCLSSYLGVPGWQAHTLLILASGASNSGSHACAASALPTEPFPAHRFIFKTLILIKRVSRQFRQSKNWDSPAFPAVNIPRLKINPKAKCLS